MVVRPRSGREEAAVVALPMAILLVTFVLSLVLGTPAR